MLQQTLPLSLLVVAAFNSIDGCVAGLVLPFSTYKFGKS